MIINQVPQPVVLLFSGQGNPLIGMGSELWNINATTIEIWDCASDISGMNLRRLCQKGPMNRLIQTTVQQLAVTAINVTLYSLWRERIENVSIVGSCGHSVGEYSALYAAGAISLETLFSMIHFRAGLMNDESHKNKGSMLVIKEMGYAQLRDMIADSGIALDISCDNTPHQQIVGGNNAALRDFAAVLVAAGYEPMKLGVSGAWHTRLMAEGVQPMENFLAGLEIHSPQHEVLMNVTAKPEMTPSRIKENLALHLTHTVRWTDSLDYFLHLPTSVTFLEISNKPYLGSMLNDFSGFDPQRVVHCRNALTNLRY
jgi:[acyl-carrier-protein] S-malonyltransferase